MTRTAVFLNLSNRKDEGYEIVVESMETGVIPTKTVHIVPPGGRVHLQSGEWISQINEMDLSEVPQEYEYLTCVVGKQV